MINDVSKGTEILMIRIKKKVYELPKRKKTKRNRVVRGPLKETCKNLQNVLKKSTVAATTPSQRSWLSVKAVK
jgi:hypothetical protein